MERFQRTKSTCPVANTGHSPSYPLEPRHQSQITLSNTKRRILNRIPLSRDAAPRGRAPDSVAQSATCARRDLFSIPSLRPRSLTLGSCDRPFRAQNGFCRGENAYESRVPPLEERESPVGLFSSALGRWPPRGRRRSDRAGRRSGHARARRREAPFRHDRERFRMD